MDEILLKRQAESMGASLKIQTLPYVPQRFERQRIIRILKVKAGPRGEVFTFACRPVARDEQVMGAVDVRPQERRLVLIVRPPPPKRRL